MNSVHAWPDGPRCPVLGADDVHVWRIELDVPSDARAELERHLSIEERERARRYVLRRDAERFITGHGMLRTILSAYLDTAPSAIRFQAGEYGKPRVQRERADDGLSFNFTHSDAIALCAVTRGRSVGVDVERIRPMPDMEQITQRFFSAYECAALRAVPAELREEAFYACWSRKEAYIKGRGLGLSLALDSFDVSVAPGEAAELIARRGEAKTVNEWELHELRPALGYTGALAVEGVSAKITLWHSPTVELSAVPAWHVPVSSGNYRGVE